MDDPCCNCSQDQGNPQCSTGCLNKEANGNSSHPSHSQPHNSTSTAKSVSTTAALQSLGSIKGSSQSKHLPLIIGAAVGGALLLILLSLGVFFCIRKRRKPRKAPSAEVRGMIFRSARVSPCPVPREWRRLTPPHAHGWQHARALPVRFRVRRASDRGSDGRGGAERRASGVHAGQLPRPRCREGR
jgi:hypothetical protein